MEPLMYTAIAQMIQQKKLDDGALKERTDRDQWAKRLAYFSMRDGGLLWNGFKVPTIEKMEQVLQPFHFCREKHMKDPKVLKKALSGVGVALPTIL